MNVARSTGFWRVPAVTLAREPRGAVRDFWPGRRPPPHGPTWEPRIGAPTPEAQGGSGPRLPQGRALNARSLSTTTARHTTHRLPWARYPTLAVQRRFVRTRSPVLESLRREAPTQWLQGPGPRRFRPVAPWNPAVARAQGILLRSSQAAWWGLQRLGRLRCGAGAQASSARGNKPSPGPRATPRGRRSQKLLRPQVSRPLRP